MKVVLLFSVFAVMGFGVYSNNLLDELPPALTIPKTRRTGSGRIVGGNEIKQKDRELFKHQVLLLTLHPDGHERPCGGSIISERCIVTAAHCTKGKISGRVYIGLYNMDSVGDDSVLPTYTQRINITKDNWVNHPDFIDDYSGVINDLAIINLPEPIEFGEFAGPIEVECDDTQRHENEKVSISGWGLHSDSAKTTILRAAEVQTAPSHVCESLEPWQLLPSMICVPGTNTIGACTGDSGGPIVSTVNGKLLGATSFGGFGCENDKPRVFTRLSSFAKWIQNNTVDHIKNC